MVILVIMAGYGYTQMQGHMMGSEAPQRAGGYYPCGQMMGSGMGMMGPGYGGRMMGSGMGMMGPGYGGHMMGSGDEESRRKFLDDTVDTRREMHNRKFDYFEASRNPDTKPETILKLKKEMRALQIRMLEKAPL